MGVSTLYMTQNLARFLVLVLLPLALSGLGSGLKGATMLSAFDSAALAPPGPWMHRVIVEDFWESFYLRQLAESPVRFTDGALRRRLHAELLKRSRKNGWNAAERRLLAPRDNNTADLPLVSILQSNGFSPLQVDQIFSDLRLVLGVADPGRVALNGLVKPLLHYHLKYPPRLPNELLMDLPSDFIRAVSEGGQRRVFREPELRYRLASWLLFHEEARLYPYLFAKGVQMLKPIAVNGKVPGPLELITVSNPGKFSLRDAPNPLPRRLPWLDQSARSLAAAT